jgi:hypothetical protein
MNYHRAKLDITNKLKSKLEPEESFYVRFIKIQVKNLLSEESTIQGKVFAAEMLGGFVDDHFVVGILEEALITYEDQFLLAKTIKKALNRDYVLPDEDDYEKFLRESGLKKEMYLNKLEDKAVQAANSKKAGKEAIETLKYRAAYNNCVKRS